MGSRFIIFFLFCYFSSCVVINKETSNQFIQLAEPFGSYDSVNLSIKINIKSYDKVNPSIFLPYFVKKIIHIILSSRILIRKNFGFIWLFSRTNSMKLQCIKIQMHVFLSHYMLVQISFFWERLISIEKLLEIRV